MFEILFEDDSLIVVNKSPGILTQAPRGIDSLEIQVKVLLNNREGGPDGGPDDIYLGIVHRLDRPASGVLVFAKTQAAARRLSKQFEQRRVAKTYWAFVEGDVSPAEGSWTDTLYKIHGMAQAEVVPADHPGGKNAVLHYRALLTNTRGTWLEIELETGRTHQIRVQSASRGHPILGDAQYGATVSFGEQHEDVRLRAIALHARSLAVSHPVTGEAIEIVATPSKAWQELELPHELF